MGTRNPLVYTFATFVGENVADVHESRILPYHCNVDADGAIENMVKYAEHSESSDEEIERLLQIAIDSDNAIMV